MDLVAIGVIRTSWGVKGWLKVKSFSGEWDHFLSLESITLKNRKSGIGRKYRVEGVKLHNGGLIIKLSGIDTPELGKTLSGSEILVSKELVSPLAENEWYIYDLVGLNLVDKDGRSLGKITGIIESSDDLLEIKQTSGKYSLIPFRSEFVEEPDLEKGIIILNETWLLEQS